MYKRQSMHLANPHDLQLLINIIGLGLGLGRPYLELVSDPIYLIFDIVDLLST